jgi:dihydroflavonol-4-reductase
MVYVSDLADAFLRACTLPSAANQEMIVAGPEAVPLRELLQTLASLSNRNSSGPRLPLKPMLVLAAVTEDVCNLLKINPPLYRRRMDFYTNDAAFDSSRARRVLDWEPKTSLRDGLAQTMEHTSTAGPPSARPPALARSDREARTPHSPATRRAAR